MMFNLNYNKAQQIQKEIKTRILFTPFIDISRCPIINTLSRCMHEHLDEKYPNHLQ